jgi:hypothetical protein
MRASISGTSRSEPGYTALSSESTWGLNVLLGDVALAHNDDVSERVGIQFWGLSDNLFIRCFFMFRDSSVGITTAYGLEGPGIESR